MYHASKFERTDGVVRKEQELPRAGLVHTYGKGGLILTPAPRGGGARETVAVTAYGNFP